MNFENLPDNWKVVRLGRVAEISPAKYSEYYGSEILFIPMELIPQGEKAIVDFEVRSRDEVKSGIPVYPNDLLIAKITPCFENGKIGFVPNKSGYFIATTEVYPIRPKGKIDMKFLFYFLKLSEIREHLKKPNDRNLWEEKSS